jgi:hypothetical protein
MEEQNMDWDPEKAKELMSERRLRMPVSFIRSDCDEPNIQIQIPEPPEKVIKRTAPIIVTTKKNNNALF